MKGYKVSNGYMGYVLGEGYKLFESEKIYYEWYFDFNKDLFEYKGE